MPLYSSTTTSPLSLAPGDTGFSFKNESPTPPQAGAQFAIVSAQGVNDPSSIGVDITYSVAPAAVQLDIQVSLEDVESQYQTVFSSTKTGGEHVNAVNFRARFIRARLVSQTGGGAVSVEFLA